MMRKMFSLCALMALAACSEAETPAGGWTGKWTGVEGTYLSIEKNGADYRVMIKDLDEAKTYPAQPDKEGLSFERDGVSETIRAGDGAATGMKWLMDKKDCLVIKAGEGYCRD